MPCSMHCRTFALVSALFFICFSLPHSILSSNQLKHKQSKQQHYFKRERSKKNAFSFFIIFFCFFCASYQLFSASFGHRFPFSGYRLWLFRTFFFTLMAFQKPQEILIISLTKYHIFDMTSMCVCVCFSTTGVYILILCASIHFERCQLLRWW